MKFETKFEENYASLFIRFKVPFSKKIFRSYFLFYNAPNAWVMGYSSRCEDSRFVLFMDYDSMPLQDLLNELRFLQNKYCLGTFYIFKLDRVDSWHAVCLDKMSMLEAYTIMRDSSTDFAFTNSIKNLQTKSWVLRWGTKGRRHSPKFYMSINAKTKRIQSQAHANFLKKLDVPINPFGSWDCFKNIELIKYDTANRIEKD